MFLNRTNMRRQDVFTAAACGTNSKAKKLNRTSNYLYRIRQQYKYLLSKFWKLVEFLIDLAFVVYSQSKIISNTYVRLIKRIMYVEIKNVYLRFGKFQ